MRPRKPFQFSLAALMLAVTAYAVLFGILRSARLSNFAFIVGTVYFTTVIYSQWALFGGRGPYAASFLTSGGLFVLFFLLYSPPNQPWLFILIDGTVTGGPVGLGVAGIIHLGLLLKDRIRGVRRKAWEPKATLFAPSSAATVPGDGRSTRGRRLAVLAALAGIFFAALVWGASTEQPWFDPAIWYRPPVAPSASFLAPALPASSPVPAVPAPIQPGGKPP
jgi:hypothetical protein